MFAFTIFSQNPIKAGPINQKHQSSQNGENVGRVIRVGSVTRRMVVVPFPVHETNHYAKIGTLELILSSNQKA